MTDASIFFGFSFRHHGPHTAFHGLANALSDQVVIDASPPWPRWTPRAIEWRLNWRWLYNYEYRLRRYYRRSEPQVIHYFFPENTMYRAHQWKGHHKLIATCHQPVERISKPREGDDRFDRFVAGIKACDAVVVQCASHVDAYREHMGIQRVENIPLGVDTRFFDRTGRERPAGRPVRILTVGNWLRDYRTWAQTVRLLQERGIDADFYALANPDTREKAQKELGAPNDRVHFLGGISDEELRDAYEDADVFFLPLTDAMANDALLEALAMGTPTVVTDLEATRDYAGDAAVYTPIGDAEAAAAGISNLLDDREYARSLGREARGRAERLFAWDVVAAQYRTLYDSVRGR